MVSDQLSASFFLFSCFFYFGDFTHLRIGSRYFWSYFHIISQSSAWTKIYILPRQSSPISLRPSYFFFQHVWFSRRMNFALTTHTDFPVDIKKTPGNQRWYSMHCTHKHSIHISYTLKWTCKRTTTAWMKMFPSDSPNCIRVFLW